MASKVEGDTPDMILEHAPRLVTVAIRCAWSMGAVDGLDHILTYHDDDPQESWHEPIHVLHRDALLMTVLRVAVLLDREPEGPQERARSVLSFQTVYHSLKEPAVQTVLLQALEDRRGPDYFAPSRADRIEEYLQAYREIDWKVHGRLTHLRNRGIAHLALDEVTKSITVPELRTMVGIIIRLAQTLQHLLQTETSLHADVVEECREQVKRVVKPDTSTP